MPCHILSIRVDVLPIKEILHTILHFLETSDHPRQIITANSIMVSYVPANKRLQKAFEHADLVVADSVGIRWAARTLNQPIPSHIPGIDLLNLCLDAAEQHGYSVYCLGGKPGIIDEAVKTIARTHPKLKITGFNHGFFSESEFEFIRQEIKTKKPDCVFVGLDTPRQEIWIHEHRNVLNTSVIMGVGGSFDILAGTLHRAPQIFRILQCEWLFRFLQEPWRIWRLRRLPVFVFLVISETIQKKLK
ncbi:MAG: WecB/TagA/CpsF family glycosyltransferase [Elusimicrobia bacterium]|nr:WecB/TagA/CpsF family glycosyltransferase [Elusimicrobiota bacterium]MBD3411704.1 WecB/TagA/CpsF family glycosyltransferase [Elusimicrobiota bacterium]